MKRTTLVGAVVIAASLTFLAAGCSGTAGGAASSSTQTIKVAAFEGGYGATMYQDVVAAYEKANPGITIQLTTSKTLAAELTPQVASGDYPDLVVLGLGAKEGFTESFVRGKNLADLSSVLDMTIPGENTTVRSKLTAGITGNLSTNPYGTNQTYLMPMYASPTGLVYNKALFDQKGWTVPTTWDEMFALGDKAKAAGLSLFTYPTAGYLDSYFYSLLSAVGGPTFLNDVLTYKTDVWQSAQATTALTLTAKLLSYAAPTTVGYANSQDFTKNQQSILDGTTLFMPNGSWIINEMKNAPRTSGFQWAMTPVPSTTAGGTRYLATSVESAWIPSGAQHIDAAKRFLAYLYSDQAAAIFAKAGAVQPITGIANSLTGDVKNFYQVYNQTGVKAVVGAFAATKPVAGVDLNATLYDAANSVISGQLSEQQWQDSINQTSNKLTNQLAG